MTTDADKPKIVGWDVVVSLEHERTAQLIAEFIRLEYPGMEVDVLPVSGEEEKE